MAFHEQRSDQYDNEYQRLIGIGNSVQEHVFKFYFKNDIADICMNIAIGGYSVIHQGIMITGELVAIKELRQRYSCEIAPSKMLANEVMLNF